MVISFVNKRPRGVCLGVLTSVLVLLSVSSVVAQDVTSGQSSAFHDYFTASQDPGIKHYLSVVDANHTEKVMGWLRAGRTENALGDCKYTLDRFPNHPKALVLIGLVARLIKNSSLAIVYYERALKFFPQYALTHAQYGLYLVDQGNVVAGIVRLQKAITLEPNLSQGHAWLAKAYAKKGDMELARQSAAQARSLGYKGPIAGSPPKPSQ